MSTKPTLSSFNTLAEIMIQQYERYLPTAFDESLTLLEKVNKIIEYLNRIGKITNDVIIQWNEVMEWVMNDGLNESIRNRLDEMVADGTFNEIINEQIFGELNNRVTENENDISFLLKRSTQVNIMEFADLAVKDANGNIINWTPAINGAINSLSPVYGGTVLIPDGEFPITSTIIMKNRVVLKGQGTSSSRLLVNADVTAISVSTELAGSSIGRSSIRDLFIYYPTNVSGQFGTGNGISLVSSVDNQTIWKFTIQDVQMFQVPNRGISLVSSSTKTGNYVAETYIRNVEIGVCKDGYYNEGKCYDTKADHLYIEKANNYGVFIKSGGSHTFIHTHCVKCGTNANSVLSGGGFRIDDNYNSFYDCHADKSVGHGFIVGSYDANPRNGNRFVACLAFNSGSSNPNDGIGFKVGNIGHTVFDSCFSGTLATDVDPQNYGMVFESSGTHSGMIQGCSFRNNVNRGIMVNAVVPDKVIQLGMYTIEGSNLPIENEAKLAKVTIV